MPKHAFSKHTACRPGTAVELTLVDGSKIYGVFLERNGHGKLKIRFEDGTTKRMDKTEIVRFIPIRTKG